uniref:(northern house mosquito) hypothetical protein n=1 Tax=Culex pipiens TaxID=7175 RepID=A0A8D8KDL8_CULPI
MIIGSYSAPAGFLCSILAQIPSELQKLKLHRKGCARLFTVEEQKITNSFLLAAQQNLTVTSVNAHQQTISRTGCQTPSLLHSRACNRSRQTRSEFFHLDRVEAKPVQITTGKCTFSVNFTHTRRTGSWASLCR